jgi:hypothetical protein
MFESGSSFCTNWTQCIVDEGLQLFRVRVSIARPYILHSAAKDMSVYRILDEFREVALFHAL